MEPTLEFGIGNECIILDKHTISSEFLGEDQFGEPIFKNKYTELGRLMFNIKYANDKLAVKEVVSLISNNLNRYRDKIDLIIPVPPSNKDRFYQPVYELVKAFAKYLNKQYKLNLLKKNSSNQAKNGENVINTIEKVYNLEEKVNILLVDDIFRTGNTLKECCKILRQDKNVDKIYCLAMTRTRKR